MPDSSISEPQEPSFAESGAIAEQADIDSGAVAVVAKLADDNDHPELPPEQTRPADAPARDLLKTARVKYASDVKRAEKALTGQFDREIESLARAKMKPDERVHLVQALQEEKRAFEAHGRIPWSWPMRSSVLAYMRELMTADTTLTKVYDRHIASAIRGKDDSLVASLRQDLRSAVPRRLLATWKCTGVTFKAAWRLELYSDGTTNRATKVPVRVTNGSGRSTRSYWSSSGATPATREFNRSIAACSRSTAPLSLPKTTRKTGLPASLSAPGIRPHKVGSIEMSRSAIFRK